MKYLIISLLVIGSILLAVSFGIYLANQDVWGEQKWAVEVTYPSQPGDLKVEDLPYDGQRLQPAVNIADLYFHE